MRQAELHRTGRDRALIEQVRSKDVHRSRAVNRAHTLACLRRGISEAQFLALLVVARQGRPHMYVRHGRGSAGCCPGELGAARGAQALDDGRTRARRTDAGFRKWG